MERKLSGIEAAEVDALLAQVAMAERLIHSGSLDATTLAMLEKFAAGAKDRIQVLEQEAEKRAELEKAAESNERSVAILVSGSGC